MWFCLARVDPGVICIDSLRGQLLIHLGPCRVRKCSIICVDQLRGLLCIGYISLPWGMLLIVMLFLCLSGDTLYH